MATRAFSFSSYFTRFIAALILVYATYNPSEFSFFHWARGGLSEQGPLIALAGIVLLIGWVMFVRATLRSLGPFGILLALTFFGALLWLVIDWGWLSPDNTTVLTYVILVLLSGVLATGMSWSHIRRRLSGQVDMDDVEDKH